MPYTKNRYSRIITKDAKPGFALIIALALMAFMVMLMLSISTLINIETRTTSIEASKNKARHNAQLGLYIALGELQRLAGPDQRITARADILEDYDQATNPSDDQTVSNPFYTAVWDVRPTQNLNWPHEPGAQNDTNLLQPPAFLVSGNEGFIWGNHANITQATADFTNPYTFEEADVIVEKQLIGNTAGIFNDRYAWWIGDEGLKAKINRKAIKDETPSNSFEWLHPVGATPQLVDTSLRDLDRAKYDTFASDATSMEMLQLIDPRFANVFTSETDDTTNPHYHDFSLDSLGVLADVRNGGLKKDLTVALQTDGNAAPDETKNSSPLYPEFALPDEHKIIQPTWGYLRDHYQGIQTINNNDNSNALLDATWATGEIVAMRMPSENTPGILPILTRAQLGITPALIQTSPPDADTTTWEIYYYYFPAIVLWNPYNVAMRIPELRAISRPYVGSSNYKFHDRYGIRLSIRNATGNEVVSNVPTIGGQLESSTPNQSIGPMHFYIPEMVLPAGRAVILSPDEGTFQLADSSDTNTNDLKPGWRPNGSFYRRTHVVLTLDADAQGDSIADYEVTMKMALPDNEAKSIYTNSFYNSNGVWDLLEPSSIGQLKDGWLSVSSPEKLFVNQIFQLSHTKGGATSLVFNASQMKRLADPADFESPASFLEEGSLTVPSVLQVFSTKFSDDNFGLPNSAFGAEKIRWSYHYNPRSEYTFSRSAEMPSTYTSGLFFNYDAVDAFTPALVLNDPNPDPTYTPVGGQADNFDNDRAAIFRLSQPGDEYFNIASLRHANLASSAIRPVSGNEPRGGQHLTPAFNLGESIASPLIEPEEVVAHFNEPERFWLPDIPYLVNEALYDRYFLSAVNSNTQQSAHPLLLEYGASLAQTETSDGFNEHAAKLMLDGAFNVNSTSIEAWAAFLANALDAPVTLQDQNQDAENGAPYTRLMNPLGGSLSPGELNSENKGMLTGFRRLNEHELRALATAIVEEVKVRGPFPSMSQFVNRVRANPTADWSSNSQTLRDDLPAERKQELVAKGTLQAALDRKPSNSDTIASALPNASLLSEESSKVSASENHSSIANAQALDGVTTQGMPGYLMQGDLLSTLDSAMTVRSDTFRILAYGEVSDPFTDKIISTAQCEAIVQRIPEYVDTADEPWAPPYNADGTNALHSETNAQLGRRFIIVSFRWID
ncbi:hypothetical protein [Cerasicoccus maritimus]|uniref:hypothetical protein n=1 Tax=Cerasicoccus maritimus TaxID=490089 RepID=UPI0028529851|nr:hypothetical protein [Cerasicoccus maritimus]